MRPPNRVQASPDMLRKGKWNRMKTPLRPTREQAEMLAIQALGFIAEEPERLGRFLDYDRHRRSSKSAPRRAQRGFLAGVLEHMLGDENS